MEPPRKHQNTVSDYCLAISISKYNTSFTLG
jgi:hypothetical protein